VVEGFQFNDAFGRCDAHDTARMKQTSIIDRNALCFPQEKKVTANIQVGNKATVMVTACKSWDNCSPNALDKTHYWADLDNRAATCTTL